jgi:hypothetical protein
VLDRKGGLYRGDVEQLKCDVSANSLVLHPGCIRGAYPQIVQ